MISRWHQYRRIVKNSVHRSFGIVHRLPSSRTNSILLTFDDGPHHEITPLVLDRLKLFQARAVFFVVGQRIRNSTPIIQRICDEGHFVGNHSDAHRLDRNPWFLSYLLDVKRCQSRLKEITGQFPTLFRAPMGATSLGALAAPRLLGLHHVLWSVDSEDWRLRSDAAARACGEQLMQNVAGGEIILLHDDNPCVLTVLDVLLPQLTARGFDLWHGLDAVVPSRKSETAHA